MGRLRRALMASRQLSSASLALMALMTADWLLKLSTVGF
jgi:hypothetical protein